MFYYVYMCGWLLVCCTIKIRLIAFDTYISTISNTENVHSIKKGLHSLLNFPLLYIIHFTFSIPVVLGGNRKRCVHNVNIANIKERWNSGVFFFTIVCFISKTFWIWSWKMELKSRAHTHRACERRKTRWENTINNNDLTIFTSETSFNWLSFSMRNACIDQTRQTDFCCCWFCAAWRKPLRTYIHSTALLRAQQISATFLTFRFFFANLPTFDQFKPFSDANYFLILKLNRNHDGFGLDDSQSQVYALCC